MRERKKKKKKNNRRKGARIRIELKKPPVSPRKRNETKKWRERVIADFPFPKDGGRRPRDSNPIRNNGRVGNREWMKVVQHRFEQSSLR